MLADKNRVSTQWDRNCSTPTWVRSRKENALLDDGAGRSISIMYDVHRMSCVIECCRCMLKGMKVKGRIRKEIENQDGVLSEISQPVQAGTVELLQNPDHAGE